MGNAGKEAANITGMRISLGSISILLAAVFPSISRANDSIVAIGVGGIEFKKTDTISLEKESLFLSLSKVRVDYEFKSTNKADETVTVAFPMPALPPCGAEEEGPDYECREQGRVEKIDFEVMVNGKKVQEVKNLVKVLSSDPAKDHAEIAKKYQLDQPDLPGSYGRINGLPEKAKQELEAAGLIKTHYDYVPEWFTNAEDRAILSDASGRKDITDELKRTTSDEERVKRGFVKKVKRGREVTWKTQRIYHWQQTFKAGEITRVSHSYTPVSGSAQTNLAELGHNKERWGKYCIDEPTMAAMKKLEKKVNLNGNYVAYVD